MKVVDIDRVVILMRFIQYGWDEDRRKSFDATLRMMLETQAIDTDAYDLSVSNLPVVTKADIVKEFVEDLHQVIMRIMYCNNKEIGNYILAKDLFNEIDSLLSETDQKQ